MKNLLILILVIILQSCRIQDKTKHYNSRNLSDRTEVPCYDVPTIVAITDVVGNPVKSLNDGVYIVILSNNERIKIIN
jgi:hypothetical protein